MAINISPSFFKKSKSQPDINYLALTLTPTKTIAAVWVLTEENVQILGIAEKSFTSIDSLVHEAAVAIDTAGKQAKSDVSQTVFGLSSYYFEGKNLSSESTAILKSLADELDLKAQAYVSLASSINHYFKIKDGVTPHALLVGSFGDYTEVHLVRNNQVQKTKISKSQPSTIEKIVQLAGQIKTEEGHDLPSRIIVYGAVEESHIGKEITKKDEWKDLFAQAPKIDFIEDQQVAEAVAYSQAADALGHDPMLVPVSNSQKNETQEAVPIESQEESLAQDMGFVEGEDILEIKKTHMPKAGEKPADDLANVEIPQEFAVEETSHKLQQEEIPTPQKEKRGKQSLIEKLTTLAWLQGFLDLFKGSKSPRKIAIVLVSLILLLVLGTFLASRTLASVQIIIMANTQPQQDNFNISAERGATLDPSAGVIPGEELTASADGNQKAVTTGTKNTGDKAKGQVNIFNWTTSPKNFSSGTVLITSNGVKFTLDSDTDVASRSASLPGQSQANITAQNFGTDGNISASTDLTFQQYDQLLYSAKNDNALTGGDQKQITVVSKEDMDKLNKSLLDSLTQKAKSNLKDQASGKKINDDAVTITVTKKQFDKNLDDEASILNLDMTVQAKIIAYSEDDLKNVIAQKINSSQTNNLEARPENIQITNVQTKGNVNKLILSGQYNADLVPKFNDDDLKSKIAGKTTKGARTIIKQIPQVSDVQFQFSPNLFIFFTIPTSKSKIAFKVQSSQ